MFGPKHITGKLTTPDGARIDYFDMGSGTPVLLIPGGGDGLHTVGGPAMALALASMFKDYAAAGHRLVVMSRREPIPAGWGPREFARDYAWAMEQLHMGPAHIECNSAGGPVGQVLATGRPDLVRSLVLGETFAHCDEIIGAVLRRWIERAAAGDWYGFQVDSMVSTASPNYVRKHRWMFPFFHLDLISKPKYPARLIEVLSGLLGLDNRPLLPRIKCPTLVIGGDIDEVTHPGLQQELAELIPGARRIIMPGLAHLAGSGEGVAEHHRYVLDFLADVEAGRATGTAGL